MKKFLAVFLIVLCALMIFGRPVLAAVVEDDRAACLCFEPASFALPAEIFVISLVLPVVFVHAYFEQGQLARCLEGYFLTSRERPPPEMS
jgi:hypothetical protein